MTHNCVSHFYRGTTRVFVVSFFVGYEVVYGEKNVRDKNIKYLINKYIKNNYFL